jgi:uncharacterized membrane protein
MKAARTFFLMLALVGFLFSLIIHLLALRGGAPSSEYWFVVPFLGALVSWIAAAYLCGAKAGPRGRIPIGEVVKDCPTWLKRTNYFFFAYTGLIFLWVVLRAPGIFHWRKVELSAPTDFVFFSTFSMMFYASSFSMLFGKLFGETRGGLTLPI